MLFIRNLNAQIICLNVFLFITASSVYDPNLHSFYDEPLPYVERYKEYQKEYKDYRDYKDQKDFLKEYRNGHGKTNFTLFL